MSHSNSTPSDITIIYVLYYYTAASGISPVLRMVKDLPLITNAECNSIYGIVGDGVVCMVSSALAFS